MATINITSFRSLVYSSFVAASMVARHADGIAATSTVYFDSDCMVPISTGYVFGVLDYAGNTTTLGDFNECSTFGNFSYITVCDALTGEYGFSSYADAECAELVQEGIFSPNFSAAAVNTTTSGGKTVSSMKLECSDEEPFVISPNRVSYVVEEYNDNNCINATGNTEIVSFGYDGTCFQGGVDNSWWFLMECMADGSVISQQFTPNDDTCSGDVLMEIQTVATSLTSCSAFLIEGLYYNPISCTTDNATLLATLGALSPFTTAPAATGLTPAPSTNNDDGAMTTIITDTPTPVAIEETVATITGAPARTTIETPNTVAPTTTTTPGTFAPAAPEATVAPTPVAIEETVTTITGAPARTTMETPNTVAPATTTRGTSAPAAPEATVAPTPVAIEETVATTTGAPSRTTMETPNTVVPTTTTPGTSAPTAPEETVAPTTVAIEETVAPTPVAIEETVATSTGAPARTTMETPNTVAPATPTPGTSAPTTPEASVSPTPVGIEETAAAITGAPSTPNTVAPTTTTPGTSAPTAPEETVAPDNTGAPTSTSGAEAISGATRARNTGVAARVVAITYGLGLMVGRMRQ